MHVPASTGIEGCNTQLVAQCAHCKDSLPKKPIWNNKQAFCCQGCKMVYGLLHEHGLQEFYKLDPHAGKTLKDAATQQWAYLDLPEIEEKLLNFRQGNGARITLILPNIHCSACIWLLENLYKIKPQIKQSVVNFPRKQINLYWNIEELSLRELVEFLAALGYPPEIRLEEKTEKDAARPKIKIGLILKLGIAGFCFGNIMLLSLPEYLDSSSVLEGNYKVFFQWLCLLLSLPVLVYSASEFYKAAWQSLRFKQLTMDVPIVVGIAVLFARSAFEVLASVGPGYFDSLAGLVFFLLVGRWYQQKTYGALNFERDYKSYFPVAVTRIVNQQEETTLLKDLQAGDTILIRYAELIPADAELTIGEGKIDYAFVTGESDLQSRTKGDKLYAGGRHMGGPVQITLKQRVDQSYLTQLWNQQNFTHKATASQSLANAVSRWFTLAILILSLATATYWYLADVSRMWQAVAAILIVACPCALALSIPFTYGTAMRYFGKWGLYLKDNQVVEHLANINTLVFDKTGTITHNTAHEVDDKLTKLNTEEKRSIAALCKASTHPISQRAYSYLTNKNEPGAWPLVSNFTEEIGKGIYGKVNGKLYQLGSAEYLQATKANESRLWVKQDDKLLGYLTFKSQYREGLFPLLARLKQNYKLYLLSGDTATEKRVLEPYFTGVAFEQKPHQKLEEINRLQAKGQKVLMIGDGLNDAGALAASSVGISISDNVYHFTPASDAIMAADAFGKLEKFLSFSKLSRKVVYAAFALSLAYNVVGISFAAAGMLTPVISAILMPLSSVTVVAFCSLGVRYAAQRLGIAG